MQLSQILSHPRNLVVVGFTILKIKFAYPSMILTENCHVLLKPGMEFFCNSPQFYNVQVHVFSFVLYFDVLRMFSATEFNYFLEFATCGGNYSGTAQQSRHYSITVLLFGNQHDDHSFFSFCDFIFNGVGI